MKRLCVTILLMILTSMLQALDTSIEKIDIEYRVINEGSVRVTLDVTWRTESSTMGGFYLEMPEDFDTIYEDTCYVIINGKDKLGVDISRSDDFTYDIDIEKGYRFKGKATYHIEYSTKPANNPSGRVPLWISAWDQNVETLVINIIPGTKAGISDENDQEYVETHLIFSWPANVIITKVFAADGIYATYRIEEKDVFLDRPRTIVLLGFGPESEPIESI